MSETLQSLENKQLVVKITGEVTANNVNEFQESANIILASINTDLVTDADFQQARANIKSCKAVEIHIDNAKQKAIMSMDDVAKVMLALDSVKDSFAKIRIQLTNADKKRSTERKQEIIDDGYNRVYTFLNNSTVKHGFTVDKTAILEAVKNKKSFASMEEAVNLVVEDQIEAITVLESRYSANMDLIEEAELSSPGIFVDKKHLALKDTELVSAEITARVETQKRKIREQEEREAAAKKAKEEKEAADKRHAEELAEKDIIEREADEALARHDDEPPVEAEIKQAERFAFSPSPADFGSKEPSPFDDIADDPFSNATFGNEPSPPVIQYAFRVVFKTADVAEVIHAIEAIGGHVKTEILD